MAEETLPDGRIWCTHPKLGKQHFPIKTASNAKWQRSTGWSPIPTVEKPQIETNAEVESQSTSKPGRKPKLQTADSI